MDNDADEALRAYTRCWVIALRTFLGWPEERTLDWAQRWREFVGTGELERERAMKFISPLLIPDDLRKQGQLFTRPAKLKGLTLVQLEGKVEHAINYGSRTGEDDQLHASWDPDYSWDRDRRDEWLNRSKAHQAKEIEKGNWLSDHQPEKYDWQAARARVETILQEYGESLPVG